MIIDLIGKKFEKLLVLNIVLIEGERPEWECLCDCGNTCIVNGYRLRNGGTKSCGCINNPDLTGQKPFMLTVVEKVYKNKKGSYWRCLCDCGNETTILASSIRYTKSCGCLKAKVQYERQWAGCGDLSGAIVSEIKNHAKRREILYDISTQLLWEIAVSQDGKCAITGLPLVFKKNRTGGEHTASLDRIDSSKGYIEGNVWWVHKDVNKIKLDLTMEELKYWCNLVINNDDSKYMLKIIDKERHKNWTGYKLISGSFWSELVWQSNRRNIPLSVTIQDIWDIFVSQNGRCGLSNIPLVLVDKNTDRINKTASLDRIDSSKGYEITNIRWVHKQLNAMKWDLEDEYFFSLCKKISDYTIAKS